MFKRYAFTLEFSYVPDKEWVNVWVIYFGFIAIEVGTANSIEEFYAQLRKEQEND